MYTIICILLYVYMPDCVTFFDKQISSQYFPLLLEQEVFKINCTWAQRNLAWISMNWKMDVIYIVLLVRLSFLHTIKQQHDNIFQYIYQAHITIAWYSEDCTEKLGIICTIMYSVVLFTNEADF